MHHLPALLASVAVVIALLALYQSRSNQALVHTLSPQSSSQANPLPTTNGVQPLINRWPETSKLALTAEQDGLQPAQHQEQQLTRILLRIEQRLLQQNQSLMDLQAAVDELKSNVTPTSEAEQEYAQLMKGLPADYENRLKTDPDYAEQMQKKFRARILDVNVNDKDRILGVQQLMIISGTLASSQDVRRDAELARAMLQIADTTDDKSIRIKALESINYLNVDDPALSERFLHLLENDDNRYVRNLAADTLAVMLYNPELTIQQRQTLVDKASRLMSQGDSATQRLMKQRFGSVEQLQQLAEGDVSEIP